MVTNLRIVKLDYRKVDYLFNDRSSRCLCDIYLLSLEETPDHPIRRKGELGFPVRGDIEDADTKEENAEDTDTRGHDTDDADIEGC